MVVRSLLRISRLRIESHLPRPMWILDEVLIRTHLIIAGIAIV